MPLILSVERSDDTLCDFCNSSVGRLSSAKSCLDSVVVPPLLHLPDSKQQPAVELQLVETWESWQAANLQVGCEPIVLCQRSVGILYVSLLPRHRFIQEAG